ncbi:hypothetical protein FD755_022797 [Muntiacus reevesi]|uniref:Uncharacterized protein n=1 Tax=Muntiacus reevesi TaxID=9886 RepID=A0A5N3VYE0_MUNRE|nr:hypothetical protein FD755_022797 [Muntiacus reevesi]
MKFPGPLENQRLSFLLEKAISREAQMWKVNVPKIPTNQNPPCSGGDSGLIPGLGRSPGIGNGYPLWYSCLENSMDRIAYGAAVHGVTGRT